MKLKGCKVQCSTVLFQEPTSELSQFIPAVPSQEKLEAEDCLTLTFEIEGKEHSPFTYPLTLADARRIRGWLSQAGSLLFCERAPEALLAAPFLRTLRAETIIGAHPELSERADPDYLVVADEGGVRLVFVEDHESDVITLSDAHAREVAEGLGEGIEAVLANPPIFVPDYMTGGGTGVTSKGELQTIRVEVDLGVSFAEQPRLKIDFLGIWTLGDEVAGQLIDALNRASEALLSGAGPQTFLELSETRVGSEELFVWLSVRSALGRCGKPVVRFRLFDELVEDRGEDGVVELSANEASALSRAVSEGRSVVSSTEPYLFSQPEPFERLVSEHLWDQNTGG